MTLSDRDIQIVVCLVHDNWQEAIQLAKQWGWLTTKQVMERVACERILTRLDLPIPWEAA